jgi:hypothetical protein
MLMSTRGLGQGSRLLVRETPQRRERHAVADRVLGDELVGGVGATYQLPAIHGLYCDANRVRITGEIVGVYGDDVGNAKGSSPAEARIGLVSEIRPWLLVAARLGKGIDDQIGSPRFRGMLELVYAGSER